MKKRRRLSLAGWRRSVAASSLLAWAVIAVAGAPCSVFAQEGGGPALTPDDAVRAEEGGANSTQAPEVEVISPGSGASANGASGTAEESRATEIRFNFKDAPFDLVLDAFARQSGLPVIREAPTPDGQMTFISPNGYSLDEALTILNLNLQPLGMRVRREPDYLYLSKLEEAFRKPGEVVTSVPDGMPADTIVTLTIPLSNAKADLVAEQVKPLVGPYGKIVPVAAQNMVVLVETSAQCRRIGRIIAAIDEVREVDSSYRIFPLRHAQAPAVFEALKGLLGERTRQVFIDKDGRQTVTQDVTVSGLNLQPDPRTNSIVAVGAMARIRQVEELITLLDVPETGGRGREMMTFALAAAAPGEAAEQVRALFAAVPEAERPTVLPLEGAGKLTVVGQGPLLAQAAALLAQIDPAAAPAGGENAARAPEYIVRTVRLAHAVPEAALRIVERLLSPRQARALRYAATPDEKGLIVSGPAGDVEAFERLIGGIDVPPDLDREVRLVKIGAADAAGVVARAESLYAASGRAEREPVSVSLDAESRTATLIGSAWSLGRFSELLRSVEANAPVNLETRSFELTRGRPSAAAPMLARLARAMLTPDDGAAFTEPAIEALDEVGRLIVRAEPGQFAVIERLVAQLDASERGGRQFRVVRVNGADARAVAERALEVYRAQTAGVPGAPAVEVTVDDSAGTISVLAAGEAMERFTAIVNELQQQVGAGRELRMLELRAAAPAEVAALLTEMAKTSRTFGLSGGPEPVFEPLPALGAVLVAAQPGQIAVIEHLVRSIDERGAAERPPLRILQLRTTDAMGLAQSLQRSFDRRGAEDRGRRPVQIEADPATNTLIVSAHADVLPEIEAVIAELNESEKADAEGREIRIFPLRVARADELARTIDEMYPEPPMPVDRLGRPQPHLREQKEVFVRADRGTNSLIVDAPAKRLAGFEEIVGALDQKRVAGESELRTYRVARADLNSVAAALRNLAASGALVGEAAAEPRAPVTVDVEPRSRTLIVSAPPEAFAAVEDVLTRLDPPAQVEARVFRLEKGNAAQAAAAVGAALLAAADPVEPAPSVTAEPASNSLVVTGSPARIAQAAELVKSLDGSVQPDGMAAATIYLKHARAETVAPVVESVLRKESPLALLPSWQVGQYLAQYPGALEPTVRVAAETRLNAVVVSGPAAAIEIAQEIVRGLDVEGGGAAARSVSVITLQNADASELSQSIEAVFADDRSGAEAPAVRVDRGSNSLIVRASAEQMATIEALAAKLDSATMATSRQMRMIPVDRSRAEAAVVAETLRRLLEQRGGARVRVISVDDLLRGDDDDEPPPGPGPSGRAAPRPMPAVATVVASVVAMPAASGAQDTALESRATSEITIAVDPVTNSLIVVGSPRLTDRLAEMAAMLEQQMPPEPTAVRIVALPEAADAWSIKGVLDETIRQIGRTGPQNPGGFTGPVAVAPDPTGGALIVWANDTDFGTLGQVIASVSRAGAAAELTVKVYPLSMVTADRAVRAIADLFQAEPRGAQARRLRQLNLTIQGREGAAESGAIDPTLVRVTPDPGGTAVIVAAPAGAIPLIDQFVSLIDQSPVRERLGIRRYELTNAKAADTAATLQAILDAQRQGPAQNDMPRARFIADDRTNAILVTAAAEQHAEIERLLAAVDSELAEDGLELAIVPLQTAAPSTVQRIVESVVVGRDPGKRERVLISAQDDSNLFVVRAAPEQIAEIRAIVAQIDTAETGGLPVRSVKLQRADAQGVAASLQRFFQDRANVSARAGQRVRQRVAIVGDRRSGVLVIAASDDDFAQVESMIAAFDAPAKAREMQYRIIPLQNARVTDIGDTIQSIAQEMQWERMGGFWWGGGRGQQQEGAPEDKLFVQTNERTNSVVLMGQGDTLETMLKIIAELDRPQAEQTRLVVRAVAVDRADLNALAEIVRQVTATPGWQRWRGRDPDAVEVQVDQRRRMLVMIGKAPQVERAAEYVRELAGAGGRPDHAIESITLRHARADRAAESLRRFFQSRAQAGGLPADGVSVVGSPDGNIIIASADPESMGILRDLVAQIDQPELGEDRRREVYALKSAKAQEIAEAVRSQFPPGGREGARVVVTPQPSTNSIIVSAPAGDFAAVDALVRQLDTTSLGDVRMATVNLNAARASEVTNALRAALPPTVAITITPVERNNTLLLTGSDEAIALALEQIGRIDTRPEVSPVQFKRTRLAHAIASDVSFTLREILRARPRVGNDPTPSVDYSTPDNTVMYSGTAEQIADIEAIVRQLDVPADVERRTEFVPLQFAKAEQLGKALEVFYGRFATEARTPGAKNVTIVPDAASNTLIVSAEETEWEGIRALLRKLDTKEYDTSMQLAVIPLLHAEAASVANALNQGFRAPLEERFRQQQIDIERQRRPGRGRDEDFFPPPVIIDAAGTPTVSAEVRTNSLVVFAGARELERIEAIVKQLDVPEFARLAEARVIPLDSGRASQVAEAVRQVFAAGGAGRTGPRAVVIVGDDASNALIVRAPEQEYVQILAMVRSLQEKTDLALPTVRILTVANVPAARLQRTVQASFEAAARTRGEALVVEVSRESNALIVSSSQRLYEEIERVVRELDGAVPGGAAVPAADGGAPSPQALHLGVYIIDVQNNDPADIVRQLEQLGVTRPAPADRPGIVGEPVTITAMTTRRALAVVAGPKDGAIIEGLVRALDAAPSVGEQSVDVIALKSNSAGAVVRTVREMLDAARGEGQTAPAKALAEQLRRLTVAQRGLAEDLRLDLSVPIRLIPDDATNAVIVASTPPNVAALRELVRSFDTLPIGDAVVVRLFPLSNASAARLQSVVKELFAQGEALRRLPGTVRQGLPTTATGQALAGEIAVSVDERTNSLIVAGREEAVALVEILVKGLDSDEAAAWVEPTLISLAHADARRLAETLRRVLVESQRGVPDTTGLRTQVARIRMAQAGRDPAEPDARLEADLFAPLTSLLVEPDEQLNALIVVGTPANTRVVAELVRMLDVEAAGADNTVRIFALEFAAADRVATLAQEIFREREATGAMRAEDRLVIRPDLRTNSLVVSTSPRSFAILEGLLKTLDSARASHTVGLHVIPLRDNDAAALAPKIRALMTERINAQTRSGEVRGVQDTFSIEAEPANNVLIVAASDENMQVVRDLIEALSQDGGGRPGAAVTDIVSVGQQRAADVARDVQALYVQKENERRGPGSVSVIPNERLNAIIVSGTRADIEAVRALVERLARAEVTAVQRIERIELRSANAIEVVNLLESVLAGRPVSGRRDLGGQPAIKLQYLRDEIATELEQRAGREMSEAELDGAIRDQVTLTPDLRTNSVFVNAPPAVFELVRGIISDLDTSRAGERRVAHFRLRNSDARQMAQVLRDMFNLTQQGDRLVLLPTRGTEEEEERGVRDIRLTPIPDQRQQLAVTVDARTNTLLVSGTPDYIEDVSKVVLELDVIEATERKGFIYRLKNARALEMEETLRKYFESEADRIRLTMGPEMQGSLSGLLEREVTVVGNQTSNTVLVSASPRQIEMVREMIRELDTAPPQVIIQVLLAEVTLDSSDTWGMDTRIKEFGDRAYTAAALAAGAGVATALGVPNLSFASADFELLIRALESQGKLEVLSRPQVTAHNNEMALIRAGDNVAIVTDVERLLDGNLRANVRREDLGIKLTVTPTISSDGFVKMEVEPEISSITTRTTQISEDFQAPIINTRRVSTVVTVKDGQTVVIGGLLQTTAEERKTKVPILGDIPGIGYAFRSTERNDVKTELLVILTPKVIPGEPDDAVERFRELTEQELNRMTPAERIRQEIRQEPLFPKPDPDFPGGGDDPLGE